MTANQIAYVKAKEEQRANLAKETENYRTNTAQEAERRRADDLNYNASIYASRVNELNNLRSTQAQQYAAQLNYASNQAANQIRAIEAQTAQKDADTRARQADEAARHNVIAELQTDVSNRTKQTEVRNSLMSNLANGFINAVKFLV